MNKNNRTGSHLFFIEFIIVLFFFLIVSTVCLRLFAHAHGITQRADALSHAQAAAASVAAVVEDILADTAGISPGKAGDAEKNLLQAAAEYLPGASLSTLPEDPAGQEGLVIFYDQDFQICAADEARYLLAATAEPTDSRSSQESQDVPAGQSGSEQTLHISVTDYGHAPVYELSVTLHRPTTRKEALQ